MPGPRLILLPGMGGDQRMFAGIAPVPGLELAVVEWPDPPAGGGLGALAEAVIARVGLTTADWVGGASLGGMVALEIALRLGSPVTVLLGSTCHPRHINPALRRLLPVGGHLDWGWAHRGLGLVPPPLRSLASSMYLARPPAFYRRAMRALAAWPGVDPARLRGRVRHLHGSLDAVILPNQPTVEERVRCGHLVTVARPLAVRGFLARIAGG